MVKGEKVKKPLYKKWWFWVIVVLVIGAIGTTTGDDENSTSSNSSEPVSSSVQGDSASKSENKKEEKPEQKQEEKTEFGINEKVEHEGRVLEVTKVERSSGNDFDKPKEGKEYVIVTVKIDNNSDKTVSYNPFDFKMQNSQGQIESQAFTIVNSDTSLSSGDLAAGGTVTGTLAFEQPIGDEGLKLIFEPNFWSGKQVSINLQ